MTYLSNIAQQSAGSANLGVLKAFVSGLKGEAQALQGPALLEQVFHVAVIHDLGWVVRMPLVVSLYISSREPQHGRLTQLGTHESLLETFPLISCSGACPFGGGLCLTDGIVTRGVQFRPSLAPSISSLPRDSDK